MRIALIGPFAFAPMGTVQVRVAPIARRLVSRGHSVRLVLPPYDNLRDSGKSSTLDGIDVRNTVIPVRSGVLKYPLVGLQLVILALTFRPQIIHVFKPKGYSGLAAMMLIALRRIGLMRIPLVIDTDDWEGAGGFADYFMKVGELPNWMVRFFDFQERWIPTHSDHVTAASKTLCERMVDIGVPSSMLLYMPNGPNDRKSTPDYTLVEKFRGDAAARGSPSVLLYTRFLEYDYHRIVDVLSLLKRDLPQFLVVVIGKGQNGEENSFVQLMREKNLGENLLFLGWLQPNELREHILACDLAVYPFDDNMLNRAKCPGKLVELLSIGMSVVAEGVGQIMEYIVNEQSGILVKPGDADAFVRSIIRLATDDKLRKTLGENASVRVEARFSWDDRVEELTELYFSFKGAL